MESIKKIKLFYFTIISIFLSNFSLAIEPVEIGKFYQKEIEITGNTKIIKLAHKYALKLSCKSNILNLNP